jgi:hypothetical protein
MNSFSNILSGLAIAAALTTAPLAASALAAPGQGSGPVTVGPGHRIANAEMPDAVFFVPADFLQIARAYAPDRARSLATYLAYQAEPGIGWDFVGPGGQVGPFLLTRVQLGTFGYTTDQALADPIIQVRVHLASLKHLLDSVDLTRGE